MGEGIFNRNERVRMLAAPLAALAWVGGALAQAAPMPCKARQMEIYQEGGDAGAGSGRQIVGLRNVSEGPCTLFGPPRLEFLDDAGKPLAIPYDKNEPAMMVEPQPETLVTLTPGDFAYFMIGTTTGDQSLRFHAMRAVLPGDDAPLQIGWGQGGALQSIDVSAIVAGVNTEDGFAVPRRRIAATGGALPGMSLTLDVPSEAKGPFDAHLTLVNTGRAPVKFDEKQCSMSGQLINSAAKTVWETAECGVWAGEFGGSGVLLPGARATADVQLGEVALQLCRQGVWHARFSLQTSAGTVQFAEFPFEVVDTTGCSDSEHVGPYVDPNSIHWTLTPQHGVRLGVAVRGKDAAEPPMVPFSQNSPRFLVPEFHAGEPILLVLYLDDLTDMPLAWKRGPDAFRVVVRASGKSAMLPPRPANPNGSSDVEETVLPHSWRYAQTLTLNDVYDLAPGSYDVNIGTRTLMGDAAGANSPATGWPYIEGSATVQAVIKIIP